MRSPYHVIPVGDTQSPAQYHEQLTSTINGRLESTDCRCQCSPRIMFEGDQVIVVHNSFDGREAVEWAKEILGYK